jgi:hypothetical protein
LQVLEISSNDGVRSGLEKSVDSQFAILKHFFPIFEPMFPGDELAGPLDREPRPEDLFIGPRGEPERAKQSGRVRVTFLVRPHQYLRLMSECLRHRGTGFAARRKIGEDEVGLMGAIFERHGTSLEREVHITGQGG